MLWDGDVIVIYSVPKIPRFVFFVKEPLELAPTDSAFVQRRVAGDKDSLVRCHAFSYVKKRIFYVAIFLFSFFFLLVFLCVSCCMGAGRLV